MPANACATGENDCHKTAKCNHDAATATWGKTNVMKNVHVSAHRKTERMPRCHGDCDRDSHCAAGLKCYQRNDNRKIPGCKAGGKGDVRGYDYCYSTSSTVNKNPVKDNGGFLTNQGGSGHYRAMLACEGDCDRDSHCGVGLRCFQRNDKRTVPGCVSGGKGDVNGWDYCYAKAPVHTCSCPSGQAGNGRTGKGGTGCQPVNACLSITCARIPRGGVGKAPKCVTSGSKGACQKCPSGYNPTPTRGYCVDVNDCSNVAVKSGPAAACKQGKPGDGKSYVTCKDKRFKSISNGKNAYCFVDENLMLLDLKRVHVDGHAFGLKLDRCAGDCDRNSHCATGLRCYQRGDNRQIPGCAKGGKGDVRGWDYCYAAPSKCTSKNSDATIMADLKKLCPKCKF